MFEKILIANRGEIACRVIRSARALGYRTVAVFSEADADAPHVAMADEAVAIGPSAPSESYLRIDKLIAAAKKTGAGAIHPGYGFLSENAAFAQACQDNGLVFIGPPAEAITLMGNKAVAKARMTAAGVPVSPGYLGQEQGEAHLLAEAARIGFPLLVKAVAGGGGRGIRVLQHAAELPTAIASARREAQSAFGDGSLMLEKMIVNGRHIEIQVFADAHGNAVYLGERDCTAQRRRQKVIEEAPSPILTPALRERMGKDAVAVALAVGYRGAGTVEFMLDQEMQHYFLEMNTRMQVEHPVTEMITGYDLVEWQIRVAAGLPLPVTQEQIRYSGHAIEARLYAEDPYTDFAPQTGEIVWWQPERAKAHAGVRIDDGIRSGSVVSPYYDAMVAKIIAHGSDRADAIRRLTAALEDAPLLGLPNNGRFLRDLVNHEDFKHARMTTTLLDTWSANGEALLKRPVAPDETWCTAAAILAAGEQGMGARADSVAAFDIKLDSDGLQRSLRVTPLPDGLISVSSNQENHQLQILSLEEGSLRYVWDGVIKKIPALRKKSGTDDVLYLVVRAAVFSFTEASPFPAANAGQDARRVRAPVAGVVTQISVQVGDAVSAGQPLACVEAMKMEMWLTAKADGTVKAISAKPGEQVKAKDLLMELETGE
ncbi:acetyl/propionyl/methylcrotonyl-CoA carboxylase subunit alpha [Undibacterium terreum]|uniref:3-methylcrotonyl-CoA carboxylase subunit alpha n=1 Tax=Undibacterium terreum TaxID=1224302 RepID=A0A916UF24_9BURK|nr:biotin carboxylase N-terminal domain-containing protein [Undibacterium terreum]GGC70010.1 3-methylcrotonyl-CoA carboxylase subunit alpha [Undibacterium terreum]